MSLINKMLHDLEKRQAFLTANTNSVINDLQSVDDDLQAPHFPYYRFLMPLFLFFIILVTYIGFDYVAGYRMSKYISSGNQAELPVKGQHTLLTPSMNTNTAKNRNIYENKKNDTNDGISLKLTGLGPNIQSIDTRSESVLDEGSKQDVVSKSSKVLLNDIQLYELAGASAIHIYADKMPKYRLFILDNPDRLLVEINDASMPSSVVNRKFENNIVARLRHTYRNNKGQLIFDLKGPVEIGTSKVITQEEMDGYLLNIELMDNKINTGIYESTTSGDERTMHRVENNSQVRNEADDLFNKGMTAYRSGDIVHAINFLYQTINKHPLHIQARELLATILIEQNNRQAAQKTLMEGLNLVPTNVAFTKQYAKLLFEEGQLDNALNYLHRVQPEFSKEPDYYALKAAILQRMGKYNESAQIYSNLVQIAPANGIWWMGLGISLEKSGNINDALLAYNRAQQDRSTGTDINRYLANRIRALGGR